MQVPEKHILNVYIPFDLSFNFNHFIYVIVTVDIDIHHVNAGSHVQGIGPMDIHLSVSVAIPKDGYRSSLRIIDGYYHLGFRIYLFAYEEFVLARRWIDSLTVPIYE